jgi:hypothetical protein
LLSREEELSAKTFELDGKEARLEAASNKGDGAGIQTRKSKTWLMA